MGWLGDFIDRLSEFDREMNQVVVDSGENLPTESSSKISPELLMHACVKESRQARQTQVVVGSGENFPTRISSRISPGAPWLMHA